MVWAPGSTQLRRRQRQLRRRHGRSSQPHRCCAWHLRPLQRTAMSAATLYVRAVPLCAHTASWEYLLVQESARQQLAGALEAEGRRLAEAQCSIEALTAAAGADKESTIAALQARTAKSAHKRVSTLNTLVSLSKRTVDWHRSQHAGLIQRARTSA